MQGIGTRNPEDTQICSCFSFPCLWLCDFWEVLPGPPRKVSLHNLTIQVSSIWQDHIGHCPPLSVLVFGFDCNILAKCHCWDTLLWASDNGKRSDRATGVVSNRPNWALFYACLLLPWFDVSTITEKEKLKNGWDECSAGWSWKNWPIPWRWVITSASGLLSSCWRNAVSVTLASPTND